MIRVIFWRAIFELLNLVRAFGPGWGTVRYFAFGANLDPSVLALRKVKVFAEEDFVLTDFELRFSHKGPFRGMGYASIEEKCGAVTYGKLYTISRLDTIRLNFFEGAHLIKRYRAVNHLQDGKQFYFYQSFSPRQGLKPSRDYLEKMVRGFSLLKTTPADFMEWLRRHETIDELAVCNDVGFCVNITPSTPTLVAKTLRSYDQMVVWVFAKYIRDRSFTSHFIPTPKNDVHDRVFDIVSDHRKAHSKENLSSYAELARKLVPFSSIPEVAAIVGDIKDAENLKELNFESTRAANVSGESGIFIAELAAPYNSALGLEALTYENIPLPEGIVAAYPSVARPIAVKRYTKGFASDLAVAIFPENFANTGAVPGSAKSFYFIDKFIDRCMSKTIPFVKQKTSEASMLRLKTASQEEIKHAAALWVHLHEHFHRQGSLPLPEFLDTKSTKSTAGLEELRVDLLSILACSNPTIKNHCDWELLEQFILGERLFRYGMERCPNEDYDSRAAHIFYGFLERVGAISFEEAKMVVDLNSFRQSAKALLVEIQELENQVATLTRKDAKKSMIDFVKDMAGFDANTASFPRAAFYIR